MIDDSVYQVGVQSFSFGSDYAESKTRAEQQQQRAERLAQLIDPLTPDRF